jgi:hypothetical protein
MKKIFFIIIAFTINHLNSFATDRIVAEGGQGGAYSSINAAINAAVSGDRILIYPKANGGHYSENISITNKSLQLLSAEEGTRFKMSGYIYFDPTVAGLELVVIQAHLLSGAIATNINAPTGTRCKVTIMDNILESGAISFDANYFDCNISNNTLLSGYIGFRFGKVIGNSVTQLYGCSHAIYISTDAVATNDINYIVGNSVIMNEYHWCGTSIGGILNSSTTQFFYIANNFVDTNATYHIGIYIAGTKDSNANKNCVYNNSILHNGNGNNWALYTSSHNSLTEFYNNTIDVNGPGAYAFGSSLQSVNDAFQFNYTNLNTTLSFNTIVNDGTNVQGAVFTMNPSTGEVTSGASVDGGNPDNAHTDLDLTRNDADCYGGSYSRENFIQTPGGAVTSFVIAPRRVLAGQTISISADGYDR